MVLYLIIGFLFSVCLLLTVFLIVQQRSISKHKKKQKLLQSESQFKEQTTNLIVHDLKTPLATLINVEIIQDEKLRLKMVKQASKRMMILVQNVLDIYKHENSIVKLNKEMFDISDLTNEVVEEFQIMTEIKSLTFNIKETENIEVLADKELIHRVITNILSNSIKFSPFDGHINITISLEDKKLLMRFSNEGPGIPKDKQTLIFNRFEQAQIQNFGMLPSTGLGLHFSQIAIKAHNGDIGVVSTSKKGAEFWFSLPQ